MDPEECPVRVALRLRPLSAREVAAGCAVCCRPSPAPDTGPPSVTLGDERMYFFDYVFPATASQQDVYDVCVRPVVEAALRGFSGTVLAYGQTGSGKTHTMGSGWTEPGARDSDEGIIPRALRDLFSGLEDDDCAAVSFLELYHERPQDLLEPGWEGARGASERAVRGAGEALAALRSGALARATAATRMNASSSRSHAVFTVRARRAGGARPELHFVDLAGSERLKRTGATGERAREGIAINRGLLALGNVISALADPARRAAHVPYRDSRLTLLLRDALGGNSRTVMVACVAPGDADFVETMSTLEYAARARNIRNRCVVNRDVPDSVPALRRELERVRAELAACRRGGGDGGGGGDATRWSDMSHENAVLSAELEALRGRSRALQDTVEHMAARTARLEAERALAPWCGEDVAAAGGGGDECSLTRLVEGYALEVERLRAQLLESGALRARVERRRAALSPRTPDPDVLPRARRQLELQKELLAAAAVGDMSPDTPPGDRERAEGESGDEQPEDDEDAEEEEDDEEEDDESEVWRARLAALSDDIDTKSQLIEQLELSQRRVAALREHYERRLETLHAQIRAAQDERDAALRAGRPAPDRAKHDAKLLELAAELRRLQAAGRDQARALRDRDLTERRLVALRDDLAAVKRDRVQLVRRMRAEARRHAQQEAAKAKEVAQLRKESRRNANLIRSLEADRRLKEQVLRRKREEVTQLRRGRRAAGQPGGGAAAWRRVERWLERAVAARALSAELELSLERALTERARLLAAGEGDGAGEEGDRRRAHLRYLQHQVRDSTRQLAELAESREEMRLQEALGGAAAGGGGGEALRRMAALVLHHGGEAARRGLLLRRAGAGTDGTTTSELCGSVTRPVSPAESVEPPSPAASPLVRRGSVRLRDLGVLPMSQSLRESPPAPPSLHRAPSLPAELSSPPQSPSLSPLSRPAAAEGTVRSAAAAAAALRRVGSGRRRAAGRIAAGGGDRHGGLRLAFTVEGHAGPVRTVAVDTSGQLLSGGDDGLARWWDVADGRAVGAVACGGGVLEAVRTEGLWVVAGGRGALVLDPREDRPTGRLGARGGVTLLAAASTGEGSARVWTGGGGGVLRLWDARTGARPLREVRATHAGGATCLAGAKRGGREVLYTGGRDHTVREVRAAGRSRRLEPPHYDAVTRLLACPSFVYSGARDGSLRWWGEDGSAGGMAGLHRGGVSGLAAGREGGGVLLSCGRDGTVREWGADGARTLITHEAALLALQPAPDGRTVYTGAADGRVLAYLHTPPHAHSHL